MRSVFFQNAQHLRLPTNALATHAGPVARQDLNGDELGGYSIPGEPDARVHAPA